MKGWGVAICGKKTDIICFKIADKKKNGTFELVSLHSLTLDIDAPNREVIYGTSV